jgi:hypothetical protein
VILLAYGEHGLRCFAPSRAVSHIIGQEMIWLVRGWFGRLTGVIQYQYEQRMGETLSGWGGFAAIGNQRTAARIV